mmetsp:Transcript_7562/g.25726  ORF Transcript_7562/g.25726 Transcript_7562/m.25726 type:complete len:209 (+) Transcript_7562:117-743(+)
MPRLPSEAVHGTPLATWTSVESHPPAVSLQRNTHGDVSGQAVGSKVVADGRSHAGSAVLHAPAAQKPAPEPHVWLVGRGRQRSSQHSESKGLQPAPATRVHEEASQQRSDPEPGSHSSPPSTMPLPQTAADGSSQVPERHTPSPPPPSAQGLPSRAVASDESTQELPSLHRSTQPLPSESGHVLVSSSRPSRAHEEPASSTHDPAGPQ